MSTVINPSICSCRSAGIGAPIESRTKSIPSRRAVLAAGTKSLSPATSTIWSASFFDAIERDVQADLHVDALLFDVILEIVVDQAVECAFSVEQVLDRLLADIPRAESIVQLPQPKCDFTLSLQAVVKLTSPGKRRGLRKIERFSRPRQMNLLGERSTVVYEDAIKRVNGPLEIQKVLFAHAEENSNCILSRLVTPKLEQTTSDRTQHPRGMRYS